MRKPISMILIMMMILSVGCQAKDPSLANETAPPAQKTEKKEKVPQTTPDPKRDQSPQATAHRLAKIAAQIPQVNDATAIVFGKYAIVGIDIDATLDRSKVGTIKYSVAEALKEDPQGANTLVTSDPDIVQRIREMNEDIRRGHAIKGFSEELADIVGRIMPQLPKDVEKKKQPPIREKEPK